MESAFRAMKPVTPDMRTISNLKWYVPRYDAKRDVFLLRPSTPRPATSVDCDGMWVRVDVETGEIVGLEIEDFQSVFLKQHADVAQAWQSYKRLASREVRVRESFLVILVDFLRSLLAGQCEQRTMEIMPA